MSDQSSSAPPSVPDVHELLKSQQAQIAELTGRMMQLTELLTSGRASQAALAVPSAELQPAAPTPDEVATASGFDAEAYYIRIKPYNKQRGHIRRNQYFAEIGRLLRGGTGQAGDIPEWAGPISREAAMSIAQYRQRHYDPYSEPVCDIVTAEEKESIDAAESQYRATALGLMGSTPQQILSQMQRAGSQLNARTSAPAPKRQRPSTVQGAQVFQQAQPQTQSVPGGMAQVQRIAPPAPAGRAAALANLAAPPTLPVAAVPPPPMAQPAAPLAMPSAADLPPPPPRTAPIASDRAVSEDLTREARSDASADAALAAVEKYAPSLGGSRMRPKSDR